MKAIIYLRVSSEEQVNGNGLDRQLETVTSYCQQNHLDIVQTITDEGRSASKGHHINGGQFGKLLSAIRAGTYRNHALVVEYLVRLSRQGFEETFAILSDLRKNGVELHEAKNNRVIRSLDDLGTGILTMVDSYQAAEFSKKLSERIGKAWKNKRANALPGHPLTKNCPAWLEVVDGKFVQKPDMVSVVRNMFEWASQGIGTHNIFKRLNGRLNGLSLTWVARTLANRSALGEYQFKDSDPVQLYPAIVDQSVFDAARVAIDKRIRNDGKVRGGRYSGERVDNLFSKLIWDVSEGEPRPMHYQRCIRNGKTSAEYLRTATVRDERKANCISYTRLEHDMLSFLQAADWKRIAGEAESDELKHAAAELEIVLGNIDKIARRIVMTNAAIESDDIDVATIKVLAARIAKDESALSILAEQKDALTAKVDAARDVCESLYTPEKLLALMKDASPESFDVRLRLKAEIAKRIGRISIDFEKGLPTMATITLVNGFKDFLLFQP